MQMQGWHQTRWSHQHHHGWLLQQLLRSTVLQDSVLLPPRNPVHRLLRWYRVLWHFRTGSVKTDRLRTSSLSYLRSDGSCPRKYRSQQMLSPLFLYPWQRMSRPLPVQRINLRSLPAWKDQLLWHVFPDHRSLHGLYHSSFRMLPAGQLLKYLSVPKQWQRHRGPYQAVPQWQDLLHYVSDLLLTQVLLLLKGSSQAGCQYPLLYVRIPDRRSCFHPSLPG